MVIVSFIRHAETVSNRHHTIQGQQDGKLTHFGRQQAKRIAKRLENDYIPFVYSSDLKRCRQTAKKIAKYHPQALIVRDPTLRERAVGILEGRPSGCTKELAAEIGTSERSFRPEGGESMQDVKKRAKQFWKELVTMIIPKLFSMTPGLEFYIKNPLGSMTLANSREFLIQTRQNHQNDAKLQDIRTKLVERLSEVLPRSNSENDGLYPESSFPSNLKNYATIGAPSIEGLSPSKSSLRSLSLPPSAYAPSSPTSLSGSNSSVETPQPVSPPYGLAAESSTPHIVIVTHTGFIKEMLGYLMKVCENTTGSKIPGTIYHTAIFSFKMSSSEKVHPLTLSDVDHLKGLGQAYAEKFGFKRKKQHS